MDRDYEYYMYSTYPPKWSIIFCKMLVFFGRYIILAKHHFAFFLFFSCWNVSFFIYHFRGWFSYFWVYHFATQLCFLSTACIILQLNFGFFQSVLKDICELTEGVTLRVHVPAPPQTERMSVGSTRQRASASFIIIILFRAAMTRMYAPILTPHIPRMAGGAYGRPRGT